MNVFIIALTAALGLTFLRMAATCFEASIYHFGNGHYRRSFNATLKALFFVAMLSVILSPVVAFFDSFAVYSIETPSVQPSPKVRV